MVKKEDILRVLSKVLDPEIGLDIVSLGLIYNIDIKSENEVLIDMTLTVPGCPLAAVMVSNAQAAVQEELGIKDVKVNLTFDPPWTPERMSEEAKKALGFA